MNGRLQGEPSPVNRQSGRGRGLRESERPAIVDHWADRLVDRLRRAGERAEAQESEAAAKRHGLKLT
jgi:hypothetical protein